MGRLLLPLVLLLLGLTSLALADTILLTDKAMEVYEQSKDYATRNKHEKLEPVTVMLQLLTDPKSFGHRLGKKAGGDPSAVASRVRQEVRKIKKREGHRQSSAKQFGPPDHSRAMDDVIKRIGTYMEQDLFAANAMGKPSTETKGSLAHLVAALAGDNDIGKALKAGKLR